MAEIADTVEYHGELAGATRLYSFTATIGSASDTVVLTADDGVASIVGVVGAVITAGMDADFTSLQVSFSGLTVTIVSKQADGAAADEFTGTTVAVTLLVKGL